ncbi:MAG: class I SAM-dependent methyltransferase [Spirochaetaceae bacterium]|jgi:demethylmenaquinone methyltransferase/2-methoxy-6-polyprenyl-1,4-benzoquinol methylase|nr:class I SAM-dependent methyltransferase [Spirochaetaceae bacterium]
MEKSDYFNELGPRWDEISRHDMDKVETIVRLLGIRQGDAVLDVGTGTGVLIPLLSRRTGAENITAIDFAPAMIERAREKFGGSGVQFIVGDVMEYPFRDASFDVIVCYSVFPHFDNHAAALDRFTGFLKPGGLLAVLHSQSRERINGVHIHSGDITVHHDYLPSLEVVANLMRSGGLRMEIMVDNDEFYMACGRKTWRHGAEYGHHHDAHGHDSGHRHVGQG